MRIIGQVAGHEINLEIEDVLDKKNITSRGGCDHSLMNQNQGQGFEYSHIRMRLQIIFAFVCVCSVHRQAQSWLCSFALVLTGGLCAKMNSQEIARDNK